MTEARGYDSLELAQLLTHTTPAVGSILERCLEDRELSWQEAMVLGDARDADLEALCRTADTLRQRQVGDVVTYVVNRNINFTNVCIKTCRFCAFSRDLRSEQGYFLDADEVVRRALEAREYGATEVCLQAGLAPNQHGRIYLELCRAVKLAAPDLHIHAFSPEEVKYGAQLARMSIREYLVALVDAGLDSLPGTSAEILDDTVRRHIAPGRITTAQWLEVICTAHAVGLPTTATMMFGHVETLEHRARHLDLLRSVQKDTGGFTEFVPLSFVHSEAPLFLERAHTGTVAPGPERDEVLRLYAIARLMLGATFRNLQASWVKEGTQLAGHLLKCGVNDLGGTLMNESISTAAGAEHGQRMSPAMLRRLIREAGRTPAQRSTRYKLLRVFSPDIDADEAPEPLDALTDPDAVFGSYSALTQDSRFRYQLERPVRAPRREPDDTRHQAEGRS